MLPQEQINLYIADQPEWQRRMLVRVRQLIHSVDETVEEHWRWNSPHFDHDGIMIGLHGFKSFVSVWFHKGALLKDTHKVFDKPEKDEDKGIRKIKLEEGDVINEKAILDLVKQAVKVNQSGAKLTDAKPDRKALVVPEELEAVLKHDKEAWEQWEKFSYSHKKEYVEWITDAKKEETRKRRIAQALEKIREGVCKEDKHKV
ncbi:MAG: YdeI/OmpD-associated family protein [Flavobacteriales bacterium]|nr:YdeI/OmpD-associated family protein [Flavobacteriales bacterium]MCC6938799.1 YdeI/OmpD-associated family protein [Flavobacteriales bacterium]